MKNRIRIIGLGLLVAVLSTAFVQRTQAHEKQKVTLVTSHDFFSLNQASLEKVLLVSSYPIVTSAQAFVMAETPAIVSEKIYNFKQTAVVLYPAPSNDQKPDNTNAMLIRKRMFGFNGES